MLIKKQREILLAIIFGMFIAVSISYLQNITLSVILIIFIGGALLLIRNKVEKALIISILISVFCFSVVLGINTFIYLTLDRIFILLLIVYFFLTTRRYNLTKFEKLFLIFIFSIALPTFIMSMLKDYSLLENSFKKVSLMFIEFFLFLFVLSRVLVKYKPEKFMKQIIFMGALVGVYGIIEFVAQRNFLFDFIIQHGFSYNETYSTSFTWGQVRGNVMRAKATFSHTLEFAGVMSLLIPCTLYFILEEKSKSKKILLSICLGVFLTGVTLAISRSMLVINLFIIIVFLLTTKSISLVKKISIVVIGTLTTFLSIIFLFDFFFPEGASNDQSLGIRSSNLLNGFSLIKENFLFGLGYGYIPPGQVYDNYLFSLFIQSGIIGVISFISAFLYLMFFHFKRINKDINKSNYHLCMFLLVLTFLLLNTAFDAMSFIAVSKIFFLLLATGIAMNEKFEKN
ncbi:O-antigen ligase family protein [Priestia aryabhattai]